MSLRGVCRHLTGPFTRHPASVGESYLEHMAMAGSFSRRMLVGCLVCLVHGLLPFLFQSSGSAIVRDLHRRMVTHRVRRAALSEAGDLTAP